MTRSSNKPEDVSLPVEAGGAGERIRRKREALGWSRKDLARKLACSDVEIKSIEWGRSRPEQTMAAIEKCLADAGLTDPGTKPTTADS